MSDLSRALKIINFQHIRLIKPTYSVPTQKILLALKVKDFSLLFCLFSDDLAATYVVYRRTMSWQGLKESNRGVL
jgi:hypothetical protein